MDPTRLQLLVIATAFLCVGVTLHRLRVAEMEIDRLRRRRPLEGFGDSDRSAQVEAVRESLLAIRDECLHASDGNDPRDALARIAREAEIALGPLDPHAGPLPPLPSERVESAAPTHVR